MARERRSTEVTSRRRRALPLSILAIAIAVGTSVLLGWAAGISACRRVIEHTQPAWLAAIAGAHLVAYAGYVLAYRRVVSFRGGPQESLSTAGRVVAVGFGAFALGGGFAIDRRTLRGLGASPLRAAARTLGLGAVELAALTPVAWACSLGLLGAHGVRASETIPWAIAFPVIFGAAVTAAVRGESHPLRPGDGRVRRALAELQQGLTLVYEMALHPRRSGPAWLGMAIYWAADIAAVWAGLRLFGVHLSAPRVILAYATGYLFTRRTLPLAGAGFTEALMTVSLVWVGVSMAPAVVAVLAYRLLDLMLTVPPALCFRPAVARLDPAARRSGAPA